MAERQQARKGATEYVVLQKLEGHDDAWFPIGTASGHTKQEAIKAAAKAGAGEDEEYRGGTYRAVPARSWGQHHDLVIENQQRVIPIFTEGGKKPRSAAKPAERVPAAAAARGGDE